MQGPNLRPGPHAETPLVLIVDVGTDVPTRIRVQLDDGSGPRWVTPSRAYRRSHSVPVLGLRPNRIFAVSVEVRDFAGRTSLSAPQNFVTAPLPANFPPLTATISSPGMEPGQTLFTTSSSAGGFPSVSYVVIVNASGEVVWYHHAPARLGDLRRLASGNLLYQYGDFGLREVDFTGEVVGEWWAANLAPSAPPGAIPLPLDSIHHEVFELPDGWQGDFLLLSTEVRTFANYPADEVQTGTVEASAEVVGDVIVELARDGTIIRSWNLLDILDPYRITYDSLGGFWNSAYGTTTRDWSHANAVVPVPGQDAFLVSMRHQDAVVKIDAASGALAWILGDPGRWTMPWAEALLKPAGGTTWSYHTHAPVVTPRGRLLLFDNGVYRAVAPDPQLAEGSRWSRAVEYAINELDGTARETWSFGTATAPPFYSSVVGDADPLPVTDNVLVTSGAEEQGTLRFSRIFEVERATGQVVFELVIKDDASASPANWLVYRAERIPHLGSPVAGNVTPR